MTEIWPPSSRVLVTISAITSWEIRCWPLPSPGLVRGVSICSPVPVTSHARRLHGVRGAELLDVRTGDHRLLLLGGPGRVMLDLSVGGGEEHALMTILPAHDVRRRAVCPIDLDDLAVTVPVALVATLDCQLISHLCSHD